MNLVVIAAVIAVASAAKLDRSYLPPPSAKTAGGSPGALQTPFSSNSFNQGLGGIPKGGFENDSKGVVVDAASPGTRASGAEETGLGAPRVAYGSTNSKVGDAAFVGTPNSFQFPRKNQQSRFGNQQNQIPDGSTAGTSLSAQSFVQPGNIQAQSFVQGSASALAQKFGNVQGSEPTYQRSQELNSRDAAASIVRFDSDVGTDSFSYSFETDNGISAEETGVATNGVQAQGGFSYTGDDGQVYSVTYTADEDGYQPKGDHLPTPPPIPEEILRSLEQNAREEAAGLVDDGSYDAQKYNAEGDYTESDDASTHNGRQPAQFGNRPESDASASGTFINQNNQPFVRPNANGQAGQTGHGGFGSSPQRPNTFAQASVSNTPNGFGQHASPSNAPNAFGQSASPTGPSGFGQSASPSKGPNAFGQAESPTGTSGFGQTVSHSKAPNAFGQAASPSGPSGFGQFASPSKAPNVFGQDASSTGHSGFGQHASPSNAPNAFGQVASQTGPSGFGQAASPSNAPNSFGQGASPTGPSGFGHAASASNAPNAFSQAASSTGHSGFGQSASPSQTPNAFGQAASPSRKPNGFGQANQALNGFQQNRPFNAGAEDSENANTFVSPTFEASQTGSSSNVIKGQDKPQQPFEKPQLNSQAFNGQSSAGSMNGNIAFGSASNNGNTFGQRQPSGNRFGNNEYLPPVNGNRRPTQATTQRPNSFGTSQSFNQFSQSVTKPQDFSASSSSFATGSQNNMESDNPQFGFQSNQFSNNQKPASSTPSQSFAGAQSNKKPSFGGSQNAAAPSQSSGSFSPFKQQQSTAQPEIELTTPLEDNTHSQQGNSQSSTFGSFNAQSSQSRPTQSPFGSQSNNNGAPQFAAPASTSASAFASSMSSVPQKFNSRPSGSNGESPSPFSNQRPKNQYKEENNFGQSQFTNSFSQNQPSDAQFAPSTQRPIFSQNTQAQGPDDSYYYNQPSQAFNTPNSQAQASKFPNTPFNQFNRVTQRPSFQSNAQASVSQQNVPGNSFNQNKSPQSSSRYPQPPFLTSVAPTAPTQGSTAASFNGITQASASSFASGAPTPSTQFGSQSTFSSFGRRPTQQPNGQFNNQAFSQTTSSQQGFGKQTTAIPQSFSNFNGNQQQNSFQNQQHSSNNAGEQSPTADEVPAATVNPYEGEIYEYNKPAQTLPPPTEQDVKDGFGQFGNPAKLQSGQQDKPQEPSDAQFGSTQGKPQVSQPTRPQFGQKTQTSQKSQFNQANSRPQFGQQPTGFGNARPTQVSSFAQSSVQKVQPTAQNNQFNSQLNLNADGQSSQQQFGSKPFGNQPSQFNGQATQQSGSQEQNPSPPCCRNNNGLPSAPQLQPQSNSFVSQNQGQFGSSDVTAQGFKPDQASAQSFAGKGEVFGGPRKPPSFDEETGYHY